VQWESSREGGFTPERQQLTMRKVQEAFDEQGVDFKKLVESVGGLEGTPGMESLA